MHPSDIDRFLPPMRCDKDCGGCCGAATCSVGELARLKDYAAKHGIEARRQGTTCPYFQGGTCAVYPVRPMVCRTFGHVPEMVCERGHNVNIAPGVQRHLFLLMKREHERGGAWKMIHEAAYTIPEIEQVFSDALKCSVTMTQDGVPVRRPTNHAYNGARLMKMMGVAFEQFVFMDRTTGDRT